MALPQVLELPIEEGPFLVDIPLSCEGNAALLAIQNNASSSKHWATFALLSHDISGRFFNHLRTEQQTGYVVFAKPLEIQNRLFSLFAVQSHTHDSRDLLARFELFLENYLQKSLKEEMSPERFEQMKVSLIEQIATPPPDIHERANDLFALTFDKNEEFALKEKQLDGLEQLSYQEFLQFAQQTLGKQNRKRIALLGRGTKNTHTIFHYTHANSLEELRQHCHYTKS